MEGGGEEPSGEERAEENDGIGTVIWNCVKEFLTYKKKRLLHPIELSNFLH